MTIEVNLINIIILAATALLGFGVMTFIQMRSELKKLKADALKEQTIKQEPIQEEAIKQEPIKQEPIKQEPIKQEPIKDISKDVAATTKEPATREPKKKIIVIKKKQPGTITINKTLPMTDKEKHPEVFEEFYDKLVAAEEKYSTKQLARLMGIHKDTVGYYKRGRLDTVSGVRKHLGLLSELVKRDLTPEEVVERNINNKIKNSFPKYSVRKASKADRQELTDLVNKGLTYMNQTELAKVVGITQPTLSVISKGNIHMYDVVQKYLEIMRSVNFN